MAFRSFSYGNQGQGAGRGGTGRGGTGWGGAGRGGTSWGRGGTGKPWQKPLVGPSPFKLVGSAPPEAKHENDVVALAFHQENQQLFTGADDGKIKVWTPELEPVASWQAHPVNVYSLAVLGDSLYSCSNDGTIKAWQLGTWEHRKTIYENPSDEIIKLCANEGKLYATNQLGDIHVFEEEQLAAKYSLNEDVQDFLVIGPLVFNARNVDVSVTEMMGGPRFSFMSRAGMIGRFPIRQIGNKVCFLSRTGKSVYVHASTKEDRFQRLAEIQAHDMTITSMCALPGKDHIMITGGFDRVVKAWDLEKKTKLGQIDLGVCVNEIFPGLPGQVYVTGAEGYLIRLNVDL